MNRIADRTTPHDLPPEPAARHEALLEIFGQDLLIHRNNAPKIVYGCLEFDRQESLLTYDRDFFQTAAAQLSPEQREISRKLTLRTIAEFMKFTLAMLTSHWRNKPLGPEHGLAYRLLMEIQHLPREQSSPSKEVNLELEDFEPPEDWAPSLDAYGQTLEVHELQTGGRLHFPNYWNRWQHNFADC